MGEDGPPGLPGITGVRVSVHGCVPHGRLLGANDIHAYFRQLGGGWLAAATSGSSAVVLPLLPKPPMAPQYRQSNIALLSMNPAQTGPLPPHCPHPAQPPPSTPISHTEFNREGAGPDSPSGTCCVTSHTPLPSLHPTLGVMKDLEGMCAEITLSSDIPGALF